MGTEDNSIIHQSEREANVFVAKVMRITAVVLTLILILNITGVFIIKMNAMIAAYVLGMIVLLIPTLLINILKLNYSWLKYLFVTIAAVFISILLVTLNWHAVVVFSFAIGVASMYFSKKVNVYAVVLSVVLFSAAQWVAFQLGFTVDANQGDAYKTILYCIVPRALSLVAIGTIFLNLNDRTTKLLRNLMDVDAQAKMMEQMKLMKEKSIQVSDTLIESVDTLSQVAENTTKNNKQITDKSGMAADGSSQTLTHLNQVGENVSNISENLVKLATGTDEISGISDHVHKLTENNAENMIQALESFEKISVSTNKSKEIINDLEEKSQEIMQIVQVITSISSQTNLLALNASIESARAGEQGRGFAVVADQIRELAEQTKNAVGDISKIIEEVVSNTMDAVKSMEENSLLVVEGMDIIKAAEESSKQVSQASEEMHGKINEIDVVTKDAAEYSEKIVGIVTDVEKISSNNLEELQEVSKTSEEGLADMERLNQLVSTIKQMSEQLDEVIRGNV